MSLTLYRIRTARDEISEQYGERLQRESYGCLEQADCALFLWRDAEGRARMIQFLFGERFVEWSSGGRWSAGETNRVAAAAGAPGRGKGVRTLHGQRAGADDPVLRQGLALLRAARRPPELDSLLAGLLAEALGVGDGLDDA